MSKLKPVVLSESQKSLLHHMQQNVLDVVRAFRGLHPRDSLRLRMEVKDDIHDNPHVWWSVHPASNSLRSGHDTDLQAALYEMCGCTELETTLKRAAMYRSEADRLEREAAQLREMEEVPA